jgi:hypothetical protein
LEKPCAFFHLAWMREAARGGCACLRDISDNTAVELSILVSLCLVPRYFQEVPLCCSDRNDCKSV